VTGPSRPPETGPPAPLLLAIETAGSGCSAAILRGGEVLAAECRVLRHGHAEALLPMIDRVARAADIAPVALECVAVATGPGGFTGIRAGLAAAHGIALASGARLVGVTSFAAVAAAVRARGLVAPPRGREGAAALLVALDSRREDFYVQLFAADCTTPLADPASVTPDRLAAYLAGSHAAGPAGEARLLIAGDRTEPAAEALGREHPVAILPDTAPDALGVAAAALLARETGAADRPARPLYLRPPDVTLPRPRHPGPAAGR
jgi:tRNA threonylcarbamoyladenosine biosynthesis protein TsaB